MRVQIKQDSFRFNGTHQLLVKADKDNILGGSIHAINKNTDTSVVASKENGVKVNADKTKYMVIFRDQSAERNHIIKIDSSIERFEQFKWFTAKLTNQNSIQEEMKSRV